MRIYYGTVGMEMLPAPASDIMSGGQYFTTLTAAHFCFFVFESFTRCQKKALNPNGFSVFLLPVGKLSLIFNPFTG